MTCDLCGKVAVC